MPLLGRGGAFCAQVKGSFYMHQHNTSGARNQDQTPIYLPGTDKVIGYVAGQIFYKTVTGSKHFLRRPAAIAFDLATLDAAEAAGAGAVAVKDSETGHRYAQRIATIRKYGFPVVRGHGRQIALPIDNYAIDGAPPRRPPGEVPASNQERKDMQPSLFGGVA